MVLYWHLANLQLSKYNINNTWALVLLFANYADIFYMKCIVINLKYDVVVTL